MTRPTARQIRDALVWFLPGAAAVILYSRCAGFWWSSDELIYLKSVMLHSPAEYLFVPAVYRDLSPVLFFPGALLSFDLDHRLFGLAVSLYHIHQLLAFALAASLVSMLAHRFLPATAAAATGLLFVLGPPVPVVVSELMSRHYIEGLAAALAATLFFLRFVEGRRAPWLIGAVGLWFLAAACKEIFVPLPLVLVSLPVGSFRQRLRASWPFGIGLVFYAAWRQTMLAGAFGGYEASSERISALGGRLVLVARQFAAVTLAPHETAGRLLASGLIILALLAVVRRRSVPLMAALAVAVAVPILPVAERLEARLELLPWLLVALLAGVAFARSVAAHRAWQVAGAIALLCGLALTVPENRASWSNLRRANARSRAEGEYFLSRAVPGDVLRQPLGVTTYFANLRWLRRDVLKGGEGGRVAYDDVFFCDAEQARLRVHAFSDASGEVELASPDGVSLCTNLKARVREAPLTVHLSYDDPFISWKLGPYAVGSYVLIHGDDCALFPAPTTGSVRYHIEDLTLRVKYESPKGWLVYSPPLTLHGRSGRASVDWSQ
jgi:hypothetical protein